MMVRTVFRSHALRRSLPHLWRALFWVDMNVLRPDLGGLRPLTGTDPRRVRIAFAQMACVP
jgi:hypothetical protein